VSALRPRRGHVRRGLVTPFTVAAGAVGVLALAYIQGRQESENFSKAVLFSGNAVGSP
jgi:phage-related minor tail protein